MTVTSAKTPPFNVNGFDTDGVYPLVAGTDDLGAVNGALRDAIVADQRQYAPLARRERVGVARKVGRGLYRTEIDGRYLSASSVVVSALLPVTEEAFPGQHGGEGWLGITVLVPSGQRVSLADLFTNPRKGIHALVRSWQARVRTTEARPCLAVYADSYKPTAMNYRAFALTPTGIAVGTWEIEACYRLVATVPYSSIRPYLNTLGTTLVAGVRGAR